MSEALDHKSAVCLIPPRQSWQAIQEIRCGRDKSFVRWPPHINLLYPFWKHSSTKLELAGERIRQVLENFGPIKISFRNFRFFEHGNTCTVWLEPESSQLIHIQQALVDSFPECYHLNNDPSRHISNFEPHLSVGQWPNRKSAKDAVTQLSLAFRPIEVELKDVFMLNRVSHQKPFDIKARIPLGAKQDEEIEWLNIGYVASLGASQDSIEKFPYSLGSSTQGVWNFAYGANVNQQKLVHGRSITPLESIPAILPNHKLTFDHQGGMGNVAPMNKATENYFHARGIHGVHGILHRLSQTDFARLSNMESGYYPTEHLVETMDGRGPILAIVYQSAPEMHIQEGLAPPDRYVQLILRGFKEWNLDRHYIQWLENLETIPYMNRGPLYWQTPNGVRIQDRVIRVGADPPTNTRKYQSNVQQRKREQKYQS